MVIVMVMSDTVKFVAASLTEHAGYIHVDTLFNLLTLRARHFFSVLALTSPPPHTLQNVFVAHVLHMRADAN